MLQDGFSSIEIVICKAHVNGMMYMYVACFLGPKEETAINFNTWLVSIFNSNLVYFLCIW